MCGFRLYVGCQVAEKEFSRGGARALAGKPDSVLPLLRRGKLSVFMSVSNSIRPDKTRSVAQIPLPLGNFSPWAMLARSGQRYFMAFGSTCLRRFPAVAYSQAAH
jgi:hypothetical protein